MPKNKKVIVHMLKQIRVYGLNAVLGFGLGVVIVIITLTVFGKQGTAGTEMSEITKSGTIEDLSQRKVANEDHQPSLPSPEDLSQVNEESESHVTLKDRFTVLLIGTDNRPNEQYLSNTDSLIVASFDQKNKKVVLLSIPRDTQVILPNKGKEKVNSLARLGNGFSATKQYTQELIGNPIDGYVTTNFQGFKSIIDGLGGITVNVEKNMYFDTGDNQDRYINLKKGIQRLNGTQALQYARFRNDELADISRTTRQQEVLKAIVAEATAPRNLPKIPFLIPKVYKSVETDLNLSQLWALAMALKKRDSYEIVNQTLPGKFSIENGISYWKVDPKESREILTLLFKGKKAPIFESNSSKNANSPKTSLQKPDSLIEDTSKDQNQQPEMQDKIEEMKKTGGHKDQGITFEVIDP